MPVSSSMEIGEWKFTPRTEIVPGNDCVPPPQHESLKGNCCSSCIDEMNILNRLFPMNGKSAGIYSWNAV